MSEVFISYVREDEAVVRHICRILTTNGIKVWLDKEQLEPGVRWKTSIENAIKRGLFFLSIHSRARQNRQESHVHEELILAIEHIRKRSYGTTWLIPIKIDDCEIENRPLGGGESILDLQWCDLRDWSNGISRLLIAIGVKHPVVDFRKPLGRGLPPVLEVVNGFVRYENIVGAPEMLQGMEHRVVTGWCRRMEEEEIVAYFELYAPLKKFQDLNRLLGYTGFHAVCLEKELSVDPQLPSRFSYDRLLAIPANTEISNPTGPGVITLPFGLPMRSTFLAYGAVVNDLFSGHFEARIEMEVLGQRHVELSTGVFEMWVKAPEHLMI